MQNLLTRLDNTRNAHIVTGHSAQTKTLEKIIEDYYWEILSFDVAKYINNCMLCQKDKPFNASNTFNLIKPDFAIYTASMDIIGPLPMGIARGKYLIVAIDHLTKWVESRSFSNLGAITVAKFIIETIIHNIDALSLYLQTTPQTSLPLSYLA